MPRFYFDVHDDQPDHDTEGVELSGVDAAIAEGVRFAGAILAEQADRGWNGDERRVVIRNDENIVLLSICFQTVNSPSLRGVHPGG